MAQKKQTKQFRSLLEALGDKRLQAMIGGYVDAMNLPWSYVPFGKQLQQKTGMEALGLLPALRTLAPAMFQSYMQAMQEHPAATEVGFMTPAFLSGKPGNLTEAVTRPLATGLPYLGDLDEQLFPQKRADEELPPIEFPNDMPLQQPVKQPKLNDVPIDVLINEMRRNKVRVE